MPELCDLVPDLTEASLEAWAEQIADLETGSRIFLRPTEMQIDAARITLENAEALTKAAIDSLFAASRIVTPDERSAYIRTPEDCYVFELFQNGEHRMDAHRNHPPHYSLDLAGVVVMSVRAVRTLYPDHTTQQIIWRIEPEVERREAKSASKRFGLAAVPAHYALYMRLVATPLGI